MSSQQVRTDSIPDAIADLAAGRPVVVLDAADRENEGDLVMAADAASAAWMALFTRHGSGFICTPMSAERADALELPLMVKHNTDAMRTAFTVTVDAKTGVSTGISAEDRAHTVRLLAAASSRPEDFTRPGHVLPLRAHPGGVSVRPGHTEAAVALTRLAGRGDVGVIVELVEDDGSMRRALSCRQFADEHGLRLITIEDLIAHLAETELTDQVRPSLGRVASTRLPTETGVFTAHGYRDLTGVEHVALVAGDVDQAGGGSAEPVAVRVHSECLTGDVLGSRRCDCGPQLHAAMVAVQRAGRGVIVYLRGHEGRGIGLASKLAAYALQDEGRDTVDANLDLGLPVDSRDYAVAASILTDLGVQRVRLLTNNPDKVNALNGYGVQVVERAPLVVGATSDNIGYLDTKRRRLGHQLPVLLQVAEGSGVR